LLVQSETTGTAPVSRLAAIFRISKGECWIELVQKAKVIEVGERGFSRRPPVTIVGMGNKKWPILN
jgi:hypothetical protein